jgi:transketolase
MVLEANQPEAGTWQKQAHTAASGIRKRVLEHTINTNGGYLSQACSSAEIFASLYTHILHIEPSQAPMIPLPFPGTPSANNANYFTGYLYNGPKAPHLDRFYLSPVQYALVLYATLVETGRLAPEGLAMFNQDGSTVEMIGAEHSPGHEITAGSLGQTLSQVVGISLGRKRKGESGRNFIFLSDGELQIGQTWEAMEIMHFHKVDNIVIIVDVNGQQADGAMKTVMDIEPIDQRLAAFGAHVVRIDGHNIEELTAAANLEPDGQPLVILACTDPCRGIPLLEQRRPKLHYVRFKDEVERRAYIELLERWNEEEA